MANNNPFSLWDNKRNADYHFQDEAIQEYYSINGLGSLVYKYKGIADQGETNDVTQPNHIAKDGKIDEMSIQDFLYMENRDKVWDLEPYELKGIYEPQDAEFDLKQFGIFLNNDNVTIRYHYNDMIRKLGRKLMIDDILEFPNLRDYDPLDENKPSLPKLYVITDCNRDAQGFGQTWHYHVWKVQAKPLVDSQEYSQFLSKEDEQTGFDLRDILSDYNDRNDMSNTVQDEVMNQTPYRNYTTNHFYIVPGDENGTQYPWIFAGDGSPPNGAILACTGIAFPPDMDDGTYFLHTGFSPHVLYKKENSRWLIQEYDYQRKMSSAHRILESFINNENVITEITSPFTKVTETFKEQQPISKILKPRAKFNDQSGKEIHNDGNIFPNNEPETKVRKKRKPTSDY